VVEFQAKKSGKTFSKRNFVRASPHFNSLFELKSISIRAIFIEVPVRQASRFDRMDKEHWQD